MFSVVKVRDDVRPGDYKDPGWYRHPPGTVAYEYTGQLQEPARARPGAMAKTSMSSAPAVPATSGH